MTCCKKPIEQLFLQQNALIVVYGVTGSGKSYTILGNDRFGYRDGFIVERQVCCCGQCDVFWNTAPNSPLWGRWACV